MQLLNCLFIKSEKRKFKAMQKAKTGNSLLYHEAAVMDFGKQIETRFAPLYIIASLCGGRRPRREEKREREK